MATQPRRSPPPVAQASESPKPLASSRVKLIITCTLRLRAYPGGIDDQQDVDLAANGTQRPGCGDWPARSRRDDAVAVLRGTGRPHVPETHGVRLRAERREHVRLDAKQRRPSRRYPPGH